MPAKAKSAAVLAKEAADAEAAAAAATGGGDSSFEDATDTPTTVISAELLAYMKIQERARKQEAKRLEQVRQEERQERLEERAYMENLRKQDLERMKQERHQQQKIHEEQIQLLKEQLSKSTDVYGKSNAKMPMFDLESDADTFPMWLSRWQLFVKGNKFNLIKDVAERQTRIMMELTSCLSDKTLSWLISKDFAEADLDKPEFVLKALEDKIARSSNPLVHQVELLQITQHNHETTDSLVQRIQEKARRCDFKAVKNVQDHQCMLTLLTAVSSEVRKKLMLAKVDTFEKAIEIVQNEEHAKKDALSCTQSSNQAEGNAMSGYKRNQRDERNAGASQQVTQGQRPDESYTCFRCNKTGHWANLCPHIKSTCPACKKTGHTGPACQAKDWDCKANKAQAMSCKAYKIDEAAEIAAAIARSHALTAEHNAKVEQYRSAFGPGEGNLDTL